MTPPLPWKELGNNNLNMLYIISKSVLKNVSGPSQSCRPRWPFCIPINCIRPIRMGLSKRSHIQGKARRASFLTRALVFEADPVGEDIMELELHRDVPCESDLRDVRVRSKTYREVSWTCPILCKTASVRISISRSIAPPSASLP